MGNGQKRTLWISIAAICVVAVGVVAAVFLRPGGIAEEEPQKNTVGSTAVQSADGSMHSGTEQYRVTELLCADGRISAVETADNAPQYLIADGKLMWNKADGDDTLNRAWTEIGTLQSVTLTDSAFQKQVKHCVWMKTDADTLYSEITAAEQIETTVSGVRQFFTLLSLKSDAILLGRGFYETDGTPFLRWVQKLTLVEQPDTASEADHDLQAATDSEASGLNPSFHATVLSVSENSVLVAPDEGTNERKCSDQISVSRKVISTNPVPELIQGMRICVVYNGTILESYPAQIGGAFAIYALDENDAVIYVAGEATELRYAMTDSMDLIRPSIVLSCGDQSFTFSWSALSDYYAKGKYTKEGDLLTLKTEDGKNTYVFRAVGENYVFDSAASSEIPAYRYAENAAPQCPVPDGAVFVLNQ